MSVDDYIVVREMPSQGYEVALQSGRLFGHFYLFQHTSGELELRANRIGGEDVPFKRISYDGPIPDLFSRVQEELYLRALDFAEELSEERGLPFSIDSVVEGVFNCGTGNVSGEE